MTWESRRNGSYFYRKEWQGGRCVSNYLGRGDLAQMVEALTTERREEAAQQRQAERLALTPLQQADAEFETVVESVRLLTKQKLLAAGFHQHKGQWRKKRMGRNTQTHSAKSAQLKTVALIRRARQTAATSAEIAAACDAVENDGVFKMADLTNVMKAAMENLIEHLSPQDAVSQECVRRNCARIARELSEPGDGALERMLIEQIVLCWLRMGAAERKYSDNTAGGCLIKVGEYWEKRLTATQKRYLKACEALARVRKLLRPAKPAVYVGEINALMSGVPLGEIPRFREAIRKGLHPDG